DRLILGTADREGALAARPRSERAPTLLVVVGPLPFRQLVEAPVQAIQEQELVPIGLEGLQELPELEIRFAVHHREARLRLVPVRLEEEEDAARRGGRLSAGARRRHGFEKGQAERDAACAAEQRTSRESLHGRSSSRGRYKNASVRVSATSSSERLCFSAKACSSTAMEQASAASTSRPKKKRKVCLT